MCILVIQVMERLRFISIIIQIMEVSSRTFQKYKKYEIKPYIAVENIDYQTLASEIMNFSLSELEVVVGTMKRVLNKEIDSSSFSQNIVIVEYNSQKAIIKHFDENIGEEQTIEIYTMLIEYISMLRGAKIN